MKITSNFPLLFLLLLPVFSTGQETFNKRMRFGFEAAVLTSVLSTDSVIYAIAVFADTVFPYKAGTAFLKFDTDGELLDIKTIKSTEKTYEAWFGDLTSLPYGGFAVSGYSRDTTISSFIIRYDDNGDSLFISSFLNPFHPSEDFSVPGGGMVVQEGGFAVLNTITSISASSQFQFIRTDSLGNKEWDKIYGNSSMDRASSFLKTPDGGYILGGIRTNQHTNNKDYTFQCHIFKVDSLGNIEWDYLSPISLGLRDAANDMVLLDDGSLVVASGIGHEQDRSSVNVVYFEKMAFKLSPSGEIVWDVKFTDEDTTSLSKTTELIKLNDNSGFIIGGMAYEALPYPKYYAVRGWLAKISNEGEKIWTRQYVFLDDGEDEHSIYDLKETPDGGYIICGEAKEEESGTFYPQQAWLLKLDQYGCLVPGCHLLDAVNDEKEKPLQLVIYPNPAKDYLNFQLQSPSPMMNGQFRIVDMSGAVVRSFQVDIQTGDTYLVPVWDWAGGIYLLQFMDMENDVVVSKKFMVSH